MELFSRNDKLVRKELAEKLYNCRNSDNYINNFIGIVDEFISNHTFESDDNFVFGARKKFLYNEFFDYLDNKEKHKSDDTVRFAVGNLEEFICENNYGSFAHDVDKTKWKDGKIIDGKDIDELINKNDNYSRKGYICLEEKEYIVKMLDRLKKEMFRKERFTWQDREIKIVNSLCELCSHNNNGKKSELCPKDVEQFIKQGVKCPNFDDMNSFEKIMNRIDSEKNNKLSRDEIDKLFDEIYSTDDEEKFKNLKFQDYAGEINFIGKKKSDLNIDEIVRLKKSANYLYNILETLTKSDIESVKIASKVLDTPFTEIVFYTSKLESGLLYISIPIPGGESVIIDPKTKEYLFAGSIIDFDTHLKKFMCGERTLNYN